jgi:hypothetical protein
MEGQPRIGLRVLIVKNMRTVHEEGFAAYVAGGDFDKVFAKVLSKRRDKLPPEQFNELVESNYRVSIAMHHGAALAGADWIPIDEPSALPLSAIQPMQPLLP